MTPKDNMFKVLTGTVWPENNTTTISFSMTSVMIFVPTEDAQKYILELLERAKKDLEALFPPNAPAKPPLQLFKTTPTMPY